MKYNGWIAKVNSISLDTVINDLEDDLKVGAITTFSGIVREISDTEEKRVVQIEIEAWEEKADESMKLIAEEIGKQFNLLGVRIVHMEGVIKLGEPIVYVVLASIHRKEAFEALEEIIIAYKNKSPVWKKEIYEDGSSNWITSAKH